MTSVRPKKHLGQHFLKNESVASKIANSLIIEDKKLNVLEIGPGMGVLTKYLYPNDNINLTVVEIDTESVAYLVDEMKLPSSKIFEADFLKMNLKEIFKDSFSIIGNFPYNISSQILFKVYENIELVPQVVGMFQKEVAERIASKPGNKQYGILSVLLQAFYDIEYLFTVEENNFIPPPKVKSGVIRLVRNSVTDLGCDQILFKRIIKQCFNQRRKTIRNSIKSIVAPENLESDLLQKRPEQLSVEEFVSLTNSVENALK